MAMLSRVADSLYWMSRYLERAEHIARVLEIHLAQTLEGITGEESARWRRTISSLGMVYTEGSSEAELVHWLCFDHNHAASIVNCISLARDNARQVREQISSEMWEQINRLFHNVRGNAHRQDLLAGLEEFLVQVKEGAHLFQGITDSTMNHGEGWQFIQVGRFLERAQSVSTFLEVRLRDGWQAESSDDYEAHAEWIALLKSVTAFEAYCKVHTADVRPDRIAEFLLLNPEFPHSVRFAVCRLEEAVDNLPEAATRKGSGRAARLAGKLSAKLSYAQIEEIQEDGIQDFLADVRLQCNQIHEVLHQVFIDYPIALAIEA